MIDGTGVIMGQGDMDLAASGHYRKQITLQTLMGWPGRNNGRAVGDFGPLAAEP